MPKYTVTCRGALILRRTPHPTGSVVEMDEKSAASLPPGTVEPLVVAPAALAAPTPSAAPVAPRPAAPTTPPTKKVKDTKP
jgi:hypothetical protein